MVQYNCDGHIRRVIESDIVPGTVIRDIHPDGSISPFSDSVITRVENDQVYLIRPMAWSNGKIHAEEFGILKSKLLEYTCFHTVLLASGNRYTMIGAMAVYDICFHTVLENLVRR